MVNGKNSTHGDYTQRELEGMARDMARVFDTLYKPYGYRIVASSGPVIGLADVGFVPRNYLAPPSMLEGILFLVEPNGKLLPTDTVYMGLSAKDMLKKYRA